VITSRRKDTVEDMEVSHMREDRGPEKWKKGSPEEEQLRGVLRAVVSARNEKVGYYSR
jgi:hypothetical protein